MTALVLLPIFYNADDEGNLAPVEDDKFLATAEEVAREFGGGALHVFRDGRVRGFWWDQGVLDRDDLAVLEVDIPDRADKREWLKTYARDVLVKRFRQRAIYLKFIGPVETWVIQAEEMPNEEVSDGA